MMTIEDIKKMMQYVQDIVNDKELNEDKLREAIKQVEDMLHKNLDEILELYDKNMDTDNAPYKQVKELLEAQIELMTKLTEIESNTDVQHKDSNNQ